MGLFGERNVDVLTMGRIGADIYPLEHGVGLEDVKSFGKFLGGSPTNVAVAAARLRRTAAVVTAVGNDPFGRFCQEELVRLGVFDDYVRVVDHLNTPVTFCEIFPPDRFPLYFYRSPCAPDQMIEADELPFTAIRNARVFWLTLTGFCREPSRTTHLAALLERARRPTPSSTWTTANSSGSRPTRRAPPSTRPSRTSTSRWAMPPNARWRWVRPTPNAQPWLSSSGASDSPSSSAVPTVCSR